MLGIFLILDISGWPGRLVLVGMYVGCQITGNPFFRYIWSGVGLSHKKVYKSIFSDTDTFETGTPIASSHSHILILGKWLYHF